MFTNRPPLPANPLSWLEARGLLLGDLEGEAEVVRDLGPGEAAELRRIGIETPPRFLPLDENVEALSRSREPD